MRILWHTDYDESGKRKPAPVWPADWPIQRVGDSVVTPDGEQLEVTAVTWYPHGEDGSDPFVYVVLHAHRI